MSPEPGETRPDGSVVVVLVVFAIVLVVVVAAVVLVGLVAVVAVLGDLSGSF